MDRKKKPSPLSEKDDFTKKKSAAGKMSGKKQTDWFLLAACIIFFAFFLLTASVLNSSPKSTRTAGKVSGKKTVRTTTQTEPAPPVPQPVPSLAAGSPVSSPAGAVSGNKTAAPLSEEKQPGKKTVHNLFFKDLYIDFRGKGSPMRITAAQKDHLCKMVQIFDGKTGENLFQMLLYESCFAVPLKLRSGGREDLAYCNMGGNGCVVQQAGIIGETEDGSIEELWRLDKEELNRPQDGEFRQEKGSLYFYYTHRTLIDGLGGGVKSRRYYRVAVLYDGETYRMAVPESLDPAPVDAEDFRLGKLAVAQTFDLRETEKILGPAGRVPSGEESEKTDKTEKQHYWFEQGEAQVRGNIIISLKTVRRGLSTPRGVKVGDNSGVIIQKYGYPTKKSFSQPPQGYAYYSYRANNMELLFVVETQNQTVESISVRSY